MPLIKEVHDLPQGTESIHVALSVQVHDGGPGPGDEGPRRPEGPRLEDQQRAPGFRRRHLRLHHPADVRQPPALRGALWVLKGTSAF